MSSLLVGSKLNLSIKHGLHFHRIHMALKVTHRDFSTSPVQVFRLSAVQHGQAGLARAPEREYLSEGTMQSFPENSIHHSVPPKTIPQHVDATKLQGTLKPMGEESSSISVPDTTTAYYRSSKFDRVPYWQKIGRWKETTEKQFLSYRWGVSQLKFSIVFIVLPNASERRQMISKAK